MAQTVTEQKKFSGGIADSMKIGVDNSYAFGRAIDHRLDPAGLTIPPRTIKDTGSLVTGLPMWATRACDNLWFYDEDGAIYKKTLAGTYTKEHTAGSSTGNGLAYYGEDGNLYYTQDTTIGRLTRVCEGDGTFTDNFLSVDGGEPTNTRSALFVAASSQYADRADTASSSITSDLSLEAYRKFNSLPATDEKMTLISKWNSSGATRSYKFDITTSSNFFGDGSDGALTVAASATNAPIDSACSGTAGTNSLTATNTSFAAGQKIFIHQSRGTNAGVTQYTEIQSYTAGTITTVDPLDISFNSTGSNKAQVLVIKQYTNVTINTSVTLTNKAWNGTVGGILGFLANGTITVNGIIMADGGYYADDHHGGFRGASTGDSSNIAYQGEGTAGAGNTNSHSANGNGGGGGSNQAVGETAGGGGGNATVGDTGTGRSSPGIGGSSSGAADLSTLTFGGGGGAGGGVSGSGNPPGGGGGGIIFLWAPTVVINDSTGYVYCRGTQTISGARAGAGGGAGGSVLIKAQTATLGTNRINASAPNLYAVGPQTNFPMANASQGRIHLDYYTSYTGTTLPTADITQDNNLNTSDGYIIRLLISDDGTASEIYSWDITNIFDIVNWSRWQVTWDSSESTANFYKNGVLLGTKTGSMTEIDDNASRLAINADFNDAGAAANFGNCYGDDDRVWNDVRTASELLSKNDCVLTGVEGNLIAYYKYESDLTDSQTSGLNDLGDHGTITYSTDVPFSGITDRNDDDIDGTNNAAVAGTYTLETTISEDDTKKVVFTPTKDPQKSITLKIAAVGTGNWTVTIHDPQNRVLATSTVALANLIVGFNEFTYSSSWRPVIDADYHFHVTSTVADGTVNVKTGETTMANGTTFEQYAYFTTHYQFLVSDVYHPMAQIINKLAIGNERYLAILEGGDVYDPHILTLPSGFRMRCLSFWREYLTIGVWRTKTTTPAITDYDEGYIFFWDGISDTYNYFITVPEGGINTMFGTSDILYAVAGYNGDIVAYTGGGTAQKIKKVPNILPSEYIEVAPSSMAMWRALLRIGVNFNTDSTSVEKGVYSYGTLNRNYSYSMGFEHPLSLGTQTNSNVKVGLVFASGQELYIGWQNANAFGIDKISVTNDPYEKGTVETLITDLDTIAKLKYPLTLRADFEPLVSGQSMMIKYKAERESSWKEFEIEDTAGATDTRMPLIGTMAKELQVAVDLMATGSVASPKLLGISIESDSETRSRKI